MKEICKKDGRYKEVIKHSSVVKNAVILLGGTRREKGGLWRKDERNGEEEDSTGKGEEKGRQEMEWMELTVAEKVTLIELLSELVKGGVEIGEEEEMKEVLMELEEEGNRHVEEEVEGEKKVSKGKE